MDDSFLFCIFCSVITYGDVSYDYMHMSETLATSEEQRNNFTFDEEREKYVKEKRNKLLGQTRQFLTLSNNNWTLSSVQIKFILGDSFNPKKSGGVNLFL